MPTKSLTIIGFMLIIFPNESVAFLPILSSISLSLSRTLTIAVYLSLSSLEKPLWSTPMPPLIVWYTTFHLHLLKHHCVTTSLSITIFRACMASSTPNASSVAQAKRSKKIVGDGSFSQIWTLQSPNLEVVLSKVQSPYLKVQSPIIKSLGSWNYS